MKSSRKAYLKKSINACKKKIKALDEEIWRLSIEDEKRNPALEGERAKEEGKLKRMEDALPLMS